METRNKVRTRIAEVARERGLTPAIIARNLHLYPSNLSNMDKGQRSVSLKALARIALFLGASASDLITVSPIEETRPFMNDRLNKALAKKDQTGSDTDRSWLHVTMLAWRKHFHRKESAG